MKATELLYLEDSYLRSFEARVVDLQDRNVVLDRTAFYPRGGGQMSDRGTLLVYGKTLSVIGVEKRGDLVFHTVDGDLPNVGDNVRGDLDWDLRYRMMRTHSALHVLCGIIYHRFAAQVTGCQMYADRARMDFTLEDLSAERVAEIELLTNQATQEGYPIRSRFMSRSQADVTPDLIRTKINLVPSHIDPIRTVDIVGLDLQADGGTHVANTIEIGSIKIIKTENKGRHNRRIEISLLPAIPESEHV